MCIRGCARLWFHQKLALNKCWLVQIISALPVREAGRAFKGGQQIFAAHRVWAFVRAGAREAFADDEKLFESHTIGQMSLNASGARASSTWLAAS